MINETGDQSGLYELVIRQDDGKIRMVVFEAFNPSEAREIFHSLPGVQGYDILEIERIPHGIYWVAE